MSGAEPSTTGRCLCGGIRLRVDGPLPPILVCHCRQCQKAQGGPFVAVVAVAAQAVRLEAGAELLQAYASSPGKQRWFCRRCGAPVWSARDAQPGLLRLRVGLLDPPLATRPAQHAHVASQADWWPLDDGLPRFDGAAEPDAPVVLRIGAVGDAESIAALVASFRARIVADPQGTGAQRYLDSVSAEAQRAYLASDRYAWLVATAGERLVGCIALRDGTHLFHLFVARSHQHQGLARRLWDAALAQSGAAARGRSFTVNASLQAVPVYRAFGFVPEGEAQGVHGVVFLPMRRPAQELHGQ